MLFERKYKLNLGFSKSATYECVSLVALHQLFFLISLTLVVSLTLCFDFRIGKAAMVASCIISIILVRLSSKKIQLVLCSVAISLGLIYLFMLVSSNLIDMQWDSRDYHIPASLLIAGGWNPLADPFTSNTDLINEQIKHFPKGAWYIKAVLINTFSNFEVGKFINFALILPSFYVAYTFLRVRFKFKTFMAICMALLIAMNPITLMQLRLHYVDGALASLLSILFFSLILSAKKVTRYSFNFAVLATFLLFSLKLTGAVYACIFWFFYLVSLLIQKRLIYKEIVIVASVISACTIVNWNPYVSNFEKTGSPLYPALKINDNAGEELLDRSYYQYENRFERFFISYTSAPKFISGGELRAWDTWKSPFKLENLIDFYVLPELARTNGGFGPFYFFLLVFFSPFLIFLPKLEKLFVFALILSVFIHTEGWHARYTPQLWLIPFLGCLALVAKTNNKIIISIFFISVSLNLLLMEKNVGKSFPNSADYLRYAEEYHKDKGFVDDSVLNQVLPTQFLSVYPAHKERFLFTERSRLELKGLKYNSDSNNKNVLLQNFLDEMEEFTVIMSLGGGVSPSYFFDSELKANIQSDECLKNFSSLVVIINSKKYTSRCSLNTPVYMSTDLDGNSIKVVSGIFNGHHYSSIKYNNKEYSYNQDGINILAIKPSLMVKAIARFHEGQWKIQDVRILYED